MKDATNKFKARKKTLEQNIAAAIETEIKKFSDETGMGVLSVSVAMVETTCFGSAFRHAEISDVHTEIDF